MKALVTTLEDAQLCGPRQPDVSPSTVEASAVWVRSTQARQAIGRRSWRAAWPACALPSEVMCSGLLVSVLNLLAQAWSLAAQTVNVTLHPGLDGSAVMPQRCFLCLAGPLTWEVRLVHPENIVVQIGGHALCFSFHHANCW